jgi:hypothetical protein
MWVGPNARPSFIQIVSLVIPAAATATTQRMFHNPIVEVNGTPDYLQNVTNYFFTPTTKSTASLGEHSE